MELVPSMDGEVVEQPEEVAPPPQAEPEQVEEPQEEIEEFYPEFLNPPPVQPPPPQVPSWQMQQNPFYAPQPMPAAGPAPKKKLDVNKFIEDPEAALDEVVQSRVSEALGKMVAPIAYRQEAIAQQAMAHMQARASETSGKAEEAIKSMYKNVFSKDEAYRSSKAVRQKIDGFIADTVRQAQQAAYQGNPWGFSTLQSFQNPNFASAALAIAKLEEGWQGRQQPVKMGGLQTESSKQSKKQRSVEIDPSTEDALLRRFGPGYLERYRKALAENGPDAVNAF